MSLLSRWTSRTKELKNNNPGDVMLINIHTGGYGLPTGSQNIQILEQIMGGLLTNGKWVPNWIDK